MSKSLIRSFLDKKRAIRSRIQMSEFPALIYSICICENDKWKDYKVGGLQWNFTSIATIWPFLKPNNCYLLPFRCIRVRYVVATPFLYQGLNCLCFLHCRVVAMQKICRVCPALMYCTVNLPTCIDYFVDI